MHVYMGTEESCLRIGTNVRIDLAVSLLKRTHVHMKCTHLYFFPLAARWTDGN